MSAYHINKNVQAQGGGYAFVLPFVGSEFAPMAKFKNSLTETTRIFSANLNTLIDHYGLNPNSAARQCKISQPQMTRFVNCEQSPTLDSIHKVARGFGINAYQLLVPDLRPENLAQVVTSRVLARIARIQAEFKNLDAGDGDEREEGLAPSTHSNRAGQGPISPGHTGQHPARTSARTAPRSQASKKRP